jgi:hypothetical protein
MGGNLHFVHNGEAHSDNDVDSRHSAVRGLKIQGGHHHFVGRRAQMGMSQSETCALDDHRAVWTRGVENENKSVGGSGSAVKGG